jgi:quercetin 2,3-dioxygenase
MSHTTHHPSGSSATSPAGFAVVARTIPGLPTSDGAGVKLRRVIGTPQLPDLDPFLLLDEFGTDRAEDYIAGFPDHPHRGFETVTYMLDGRMRHRDNHGNEGLLVPGGVQWMTAGRGLIHSEMPEQQAGRMRGFQLWVNLPAALKMSAPRYQEFAPEALPVARPADGVCVKIIAGSVIDSDGALLHGPIEQAATSPLYLDIALDAGAEWVCDLPDGHNAFLYGYEGTMRIGTGAAEHALETQTLGVLGVGTRLRVHARDAAARAILVAGRPLREPIARHGPFVMNTREELMQAFSDFRDGKF